MKRIQRSAKRPGRPLSFDRDKALQAAMLQFWCTGYETTSVSDLTKAMGITAPSLYTAFGDKEQLFMEALRRYSNSGPKLAVDMIREASSAREAARQILDGSAIFFTQERMPPGCLIASAATTGSDESQQVRAAIKKIRLELQGALSTRIEVDKIAGILPADANPSALAGMVVGIVQGMSTLARDGANRDELLAIASAVLAGWPSAIAKRRSQLRGNARRSTNLKRAGTSM